MQNKKGFSIIEVILAGSILAIIVFGIVAAWLYGEHALIKSGDTGRGVAIASEGIEITRNLRDFDFGALSDGTYSLTNIGSGWTLTPNEKEKIGPYERYITIASDGISKKNITSTVEWTNVDGTPGIISSSTILTNWTQIKKVPPRDTALTITEVVASPSLNSVVITWTTNKIASSRVEYGTTASYGTLTAETNTSPRLLSHSVQINSLSLNTTYHFRVKSIDATGAIAYSIDSTFITDSDTTAPIISNIVVSPGSSNVTITWDTNEASNTYMTYGITGQSMSDTSIQQIGFTHHTLTIPSGLAALTEYTFVLHSADTSGNIGSSTSATFTTTGNPPVISNIVVETISATYVTISWDTDVITNARITNQFAPFESSPLVDTSPMTLTHTVTISGLVPCSAEYFGLLLTSTNANGLSGNGDPGGITTKGCPPTVISTATSSMIDISDIAVEPFDVQDDASYIYAINKITPELSTIVVRNSVIEAEIFYDGSALSSWEISAPVDIFSLRDYLYVVNADSHNSIKIFSIDNTHNGDIALIDTFAPELGIASAVFIKEMTVGASTDYLLFLSFPGKVYVYNMKTVNGMTNLGASSNWAQIGYITLTNEIVATDLYVTQLSGGKQTLYAISDAGIYLTDVAGGALAGSFTEGSFSLSPYSTQITGSDTHELSLVTGYNYMKEMPIGGGTVSDTVYNKVKALSKSITTDGMMFFNSDLPQEEFGMFPVSGTTIGAYTSLDLGSYIDSNTDYGASVGASVGYLELNHLVFFSKLNKMLLIDPSI